MSQPGDVVPAVPPASGPAGDTAPSVPWRWWDALLVLALVYLSGAFVVPLLESLGAYFNVTLIVVAGLLTIALTLTVARRRYGVEAAKLLWGHRRPSAMDVLVGVGAAIVGQLGVWIMVFLLTMGGQAPAVQEDLRQAAANPATLPFMALGAVLLIPVAEELLYRGMLFQGLRTRYGRWPAIGLSGFFFGLLHAQWGDLGATMLLLAAFYPLGMWLAWVFDRRGSLLATIVCHAVYNGGNLALFLSGR